MSGRDDIIDDVKFEAGLQTVIFYKTKIGYFQRLFGYYSDELSFSKDELIGLTVDEAHNLFFKKDKSYLQS
jgi:hypothetical protein